jgi:hypothetical protein
MALLHKSDLTPTKIELLTGWAPAQPWFEGEADAAFTNVAAYRFDDPDGQVGIETILVRAGSGPLLQVPLTYRGAPLAGAEAFLIGTTEHSVLGKRWVYDAVGDPAYVAAVANAALSGGRQAELVVEIDGERVVREPTAVVAGSGTEGSTAVTVPDVAEIGMRPERGVTVVEAGGLRLVVARVLGDEDILLDKTPAAAVHEVLAGTWPEQPSLRVLVLAELLQD